MRANGNRRERGAYFTPANLARFLADWAIRSSDDVVLDPSAGLGSLMEAAANRAEALGQAGSPDVWGVELHRNTFARLARRCAELQIHVEQLRKGDFFGVSEELGTFDVILTNPPYVRHHELPVRVARKMRETLRTIGASIDGRASSWAYFVVRSAQLLREGGRLAAIVPGELVSADYGHQVIEQLRKRFKTTVLVRCDGTLFGNLQLATIAILADGYGADPAPAGAVYGCSVSFDEEQPRLPSVRRMLRIRDPRRSASLLFTGARPTDLKLVEEVFEAERLHQVGELASVGIGYVTGDTRFFHFTESERNEASLAVAHLKRSVSRGTQICGSVFRSDDWELLRDTDKPCWVFHPLGEDDAAVRRVVCNGLEKGVADRMKCRSRTPWWRVPLGDAPQAMLVYLGKRPRIVENQARAYAANTLFSIAVSAVPAASLALGSMTSVFQLSALLAARRLGGGLRKLQVRDAASLPIPVVDAPRGECDEVDSLVRAGAWGDAVRRADEVVLRKGLGWSAKLVEQWQVCLNRLDP